MRRWVLSREFEWLNEYEQETDIEIPDGVSAGPAGQPVPSQRLLQPHHRPLAQP